MFSHHSEDGFVPALPGITRKTLVHGEKTLLAEFHLAKGSLLPSHSHPNEQTGYLVSGRMSFTIGDQTERVEAGDSWCVPADVLHSVDVLEDSIVVEVFSPVRTDYLP